MNTVALGEIESSAKERRVIEPVCQCSSSRPVLSTNGYSSSGQLPGGHPLGGHQVREPVLGVELVLEEDDRAVGVLGVGVGVELAGRPEVAVGEVGVVGHQRDELVEDLLRRAVVHLKADAVGDVLDDLPVHPRLPGRVEHLAPALDAAVGVGVGAVLLQIGGGGQDDVGELGGLGEEDVLHREEVQRAQRLADLVDVGSDRNGFSPIMYIPRTPFFSAAPTISVTVSPRSWSSSRPQARSKRSQAAGRSTGW